VIARLARWVDDRLAASRFARSALNKVFPDHWSFMLGEIAMYCLVILIFTGIYLTFFFHPGATDVVYHGRYHPLVGVHMSEAYRSTIRLSFDVRAGLVMRQIHHWAALVFLAAIVAHVARLFFTGAFRRPREINWIVGVTLLVLAMFNGFTGYSLPDDLLSGTGLRIAYSIALAVPVAGTWIAFLIFGGEFPDPAMASRLYVMHIMLVPGLIIALLTIHLAIVWHQKHTQFPGRGRREDNVVGSRLWPTYTAKSIGLMLIIFGVLAGLGGLAQINPVWLYGPFKPAAVSTAAQPDWYLGWVEGALRLFPPWRIHVFGYEISELFVPGVALPLVTFGLLYLWPFLEARATRDRDEHHLLDRPRTRPVRTAIGITALTFYALLLVAGGQDLIAQALHVSIVPVTWTLRVLCIVVPIAAGAFTWWTCHGLIDHERTMHELGEFESGESPPPIGPAETPPADHPDHDDGEPPSKTGKVAAAVAVASAIGGFLAGRRRKRDRTITVRRG
jgi:ubiquinol-cytochrome c reductase cytochrome b subunit